MIDTTGLREAFHALYGTTPRVFAAPGRVNLIGEHTDYNDGFVLPMAIERETAVAGIVRDDRIVRVRSLGIDEAATFDLDRPGPPRRGSWLDYIEGVAHALEAKGPRLRGADLLIESDVPAGAGLSSSAALEISIGLALASLSGLTIAPLELAHAGQRAEHEYVGAMVGIMDQTISALGRANHALLLDCRSFATRYVPLDGAKARVVIVDSKVKHALASSEYNTRRAECAEGVARLREVLPEVRALRDVSEADFARHGQMLPDPVIRRCRHVITENARTLAAADALARGDLATMGALMLASHVSLRDDYEVSAPELDVLVDAASGQPGVYGARMTGGGFGGCTVNLVAPDGVENLRGAVTRAMTARFGYAPDVFVSAAGEGAHEVGIPS